MPAYLIVEHIITDAARFDEYRTRVAAQIARHGGRYLTKGGRVMHPAPCARCGTVSTAARVP
jgi:uncharacterized protein (DUF1330 family)